MTASSTPEAIIAGLRAAQERLWGTDRTDALASSITRMAEALVTVESLALASGLEPFPSGPEEPRG